MITMRDVSERAGVSITTVSHVVNGTRNVAPQSREAVLVALRETKYLETRKRSPILGIATRSVAVIAANLRADFFVAVMGSIEVTALENDLPLLLLDSQNSYQKEVENVKSAIARGALGLIVMPVDSGQIPPELLETHVPVITIDRVYDGSPFTFVGIDNIRAALMATNYLIAKGCSRIGFIGQSDRISTVRERILGCKTALVENAAVPLQLLHLELSDEDFGDHDRIRNFLLNSNVDGVVCNTNELCYHLVEVVHELNLCVPDALKIVTFDDNKWLDFLKYPVSVISQPTADIGSFAVDRIRQLISYPDGLRTKRLDVYCEIELIDRLHK